MEKETSGTDELMVGLGALDTTSEEIEEAAQECEEDAEQIEGVLVWLGRILKEIFLK